MQTGLINRENAEKVFLVVKNVEGATMTKGYLAALVVSGSFDGKNAVLVASGDAALLPAWVGVAAADIADTGYGRVQAFGFANSIRYSAVGSSITIAIGEPCAPGAEAGGAASAVTPSYAASGFGFILASNCPAAISAAGWMSGLIRCLH